MYFFCVLGNSQELKGGKLTAAKRDRIARQVGGEQCGYTYYFDEAEQRYRGWGECPNLGEPFDRRTSKAIIAAWEKAGVGTQAVR